MQKIIEVSTPQDNILIDITSDVETVVNSSGIDTGLVNVYVQGATAGVWEHGAQYNNGDSYLKAGLVGSGETMPIVNGKMGLSTWQNVFLCEFDGPRYSRNIVVTLLNSEK